MEFDLDFDIAVTGFDIGDIDFILEGGDKSESDGNDLVPEPKDGAVTQTGDIWAIGPHRLICGDARNADVYQALLGDGRAQMVFADAPYNVAIDGHVSGKGKVKHREFAMASGEMSEAGFTDFLGAVFKQLAAFSVDGSVHYQCMDWRHIGEMLGAGSSAYSELLNVCVWNKTNGGMGSLYRSAHELVFVFKSGTAPHINNVELGRHGRNRTNSWTYAGANAFGRTREEDLEDHPTVKPFALVADAILDCSKPKSIILDPFAGSGTTLVAAHKTRRIGYGIEIDRIYCDVILERMTRVTKLEPIHLQTGMPFSVIARDRAGVPETDRNDGQQEAAE